MDKSVGLQKRVQDSLIKNGEALLAPPQKVYHYTTIRGLQSIMTRRELWATHAGFLNDKQEIRYALDKIFLMIRQNQSTNKDEIIGSFLTKLHQYYTIHEFPDVFLISFSEKKDDLNQWRAYSDNAQGICIEFDTKEQAEMISYHSALYAKVIYKPEAQDAFIEGVFEETFEKLQRKQIPISGAMEVCTSLLNVAIPLFKHPAFSAELEVRFVLPNYHIPKIQNSVVKFREKNNLLIPYLEVPFGPGSGTFSAITKIILGPATNIEQAHKSVSLFLESLNYASIVENSKIPYRGT